MPAVVLDIARVPAEMFTSMLRCARVAGWSAHVLEAEREGRLIRPTAVYAGAPARSPPARGSRARGIGRRRAQPASDSAPGSGATVPIARSSSELNPGATPRSPPT